ncbi:MAG: ATP/GTP-binding protein [Fervidicoccaceae archaeon]
MKGKNKYIIIIGPAGSGKTTLTQTLGDWLEYSGIGVSRINLDPAVETLPYVPDFDVRDFINAREIAISRGLGPNGALLVSMDLLYARLGEVAKEIEKIESDYNILDTPGQMELFAYRPTGNLLIERISPKHRTVVLFLIDAIFAARIDSLISMLLLSYSVSIRHKYPQINVITKIDTLDKEQIDDLINIQEDPSIIMERVSEIKGGARREMIETFASFLSDVGFNFIPVSSVSEEGLEELFANIQQTISEMDEFESNM